MNVCFIGGKQAGCIGLLALIAKNCNIRCVVAYDDSVKEIAEKLKIMTYSTVKDKEFLKFLEKSDLLLDVHGREIIKKELLDMPRLGCINVHPCLYNYQGVNPVQRLLDDKNPKASVAAHYMVEKIDAGEVIIEEFIDVQGLNSIAEVYNKLYPFYAKIIFN